MCTTSNTDVATSLGGQLRSLPSTCWLAFIICALERVAYYLVRVLAPLYLYSSTRDSGPGLTERHQAILYGL